jgi:hypothetical protein
MIALKDLYARHPEGINSANFARVSNKKSIGGIIVLVLVAVGVWMMLPELRRYLRLERM